MYTNVASFDEASRFERRKKNFIRARHICHVSTSYMRVTFIREPNRSLYLSV